VTTVGEDYEPFMQPVGGVPVEHLRAMIRLLSPDHMTPTAKRYLESLCEQYDAPESAEEQR
jgi:hypothetical protein